MDVCNLIVKSWQGGRPLAIMKGKIVRIGIIWDWKAYSLYGVEGWSQNRDI